MKEPREYRRLVLRLLELKALKLQNGGLSTEQQIEHDKLNGRIAYLEERESQKWKRVVRKVGYGSIIES